MSAWVPEWAVWGVSAGAAVLALLVLAVVAARPRHAAPGPRRGATSIWLWIGSFLSLWTILAIITHFWLRSGNFIWWDIDTWLSDPDLLAEQARAAGQSASELRVEEVRNLLGAVAVLAGSFVGAIQLGNSLHRTRIQEREREADERRLMSDRERLDGERQARNADIFSRAVAQLAEGDENKMAARIGAIFSLEALARSEMGNEADARSPIDLTEDQQRRDRPLVSQIVDTLAAFVRQRSTLIAAQTQGTEFVVPTDIAVAVRSLVATPALWRPTFVNDLGVDLRGAYLFNLELPKFADLRRFNLERANLKGARMIDVDLRGVRLAGADLSHAKVGACLLEGANIAGAIVADLNLRNARGVVQEQIDSTSSRDRTTDLPDYLANGAGPNEPRPVRRGPVEVFGGVLSSLVGRVSKEQAYLTILAGAMMADNSFSAEETSEYEAIVYRSNLLKAMPRQEVAQLMEKVRSELQRNPAAVQEACSALPDEMRPAAFANAADIVFADRHVVRAEIEYLTQLAVWMKLPEEKARSIVEAARVKNEY